MFSPFKKSFEDPVAKVEPYKDPQNLQLSKRLQKFAYFLFCLLLGGKKIGEICNSRQGVLFSFPIVGVLTKQKQKNKGSYNIDIIILAIRQLGPFLTLFFFFHHFAWGIKVQSCLVFFSGFLFFSYLILILHLNLNSHHVAFVLENHLKTQKR